MTLGAGGGRLIRRRSAQTCSTTSVNTARAVCWRKSPGRPRSSTRGISSLREALAAAREQSDVDGAGPDQLGRLLGRATDVERLLVVDARRRGEVSAASADEGAG